VSEYLASNGSVAAHFEYDPFGRTTVDTDVEGLFDVRFSTKARDVESGLYYYGYRYYDPLTGRWLNRDPLQEEGGINIYGFVGGDSINAYDLLGLDSAAGRWLGDTLVSLFGRQGTGSIVDGFARASAAMLDGLNPFGDPLKDAGEWDPCDKGMSLAHGAGEVTMVVAGALLTQGIIAEVGPVITQLGADIAEFGAGPALSVYGAELLSSGWVQGVLALGATQGASEIATNKEAREDFAGMFASDPNGVRAIGELLGAGVSGLMEAGAALGKGATPVAEVAAESLPAAANSGGRAAVTIGEDLSSAAGTRVWRNVPDGHGALADAQAGIVKPYGSTINEALDVRALGHDMGMTQGSGLTSWTADQAWALARQQRLGGVVLETSAPNGSVWFNQAAKGAESQVLIPGTIKIR